MTKKKRKWYVKFLIHVMLFTLIVSSMPLHVLAETESKKHENLILEETKKKEKEASNIAQETPQEIIEERSETSKIFDNKDGTYTQKIYQDPIHIKKGDEWKEISPELIKSPQKAVVTENTQLSATFKSKMEKGEYVQFEKDGHKVKYSLLEASGEQGKVKVTDVPSIFEGNTIWHKGIFPKIDLRSITFNTTVKEDIVLHGYTGHNIFSYKLDTALTPKINKDGSISFTDKSDTEIFVLPKPIMTDSAVHPESGESQQSEKVSYKLEKQEDNSYHLTLTADKDWLKAPERKYPVYIDPTITIENSSNAYVSDIAKGTNYSGAKLWDSGQGAFTLKVGKYDSSTGNNHAYIKHDVSSFQHAVIQEATLNMYAIWHYYGNTPNAVWLDEVNGGWNPSALTWNNKPSTTNLTQVNVGRGQWAKFNVTKTVQSWVNGTKNNNGFMLHTNANGITHWKKFVSSENSTNAPYLSITYSYSQPTGPTATTYSNGPGSGTGYFDVKWDAVPGATGYKVAIFNGYEYEYIPVGNVTSWSSKGKKLWPTKEEIEKGAFSLHLDGKGEEVAFDPAPVYQNAFAAGSPFGDYGNEHKYWIRIVAEYPSGDSPLSAGTTVYMPMETLKAPLGGAYPNLSGSDTGYINLSWESVPSAAGYKVWIYNGKEYEAFDVGNVTNWTTQNQNIWPTLTEITAGAYKLHSDKKGTDLALDPSPVYKNSGGAYPNYKNYWFRVTAYSKDGHRESQISEAFMPVFSKTDWLGMKDYWPSIAVIGGSVNASNGNFIMDETDIQLDGRGPGVSINRTYNSQDTGTGLFGTSWFSSIEESVKEDESKNILFTEADKGTIVFTRLGENQYQSPTGIFLEVKKTAEGFEIKGKDQSVTYFSKEGKLLKEKDTHGNEVSYQYTGGKLQTITDASGRKFIFTYSGDLVSKITGPENRTVTFEYDNKHLVGSTTPSGKAYRYGYEGGKLRYTYDPKHTDATPYKTTYTYENDKLVKVTDPLGKETTIAYNDGVREATVTDSKGVKDLYTYTAAGNPEKTVVDTAGLKLTTTFEYQANNLTKTIHPNDQGKRVSESYTYDGNGNILTSTDTIGTEKFEYNKNNDVKKATDTEGKETTVAYSGVDPVSETEIAGKVSSVSRFDSFGNLITSSGDLTTSHNQLMVPGFETDLLDKYGVGWNIWKSNNEAGSMERDNSLRAPEIGGNYSLKLTSKPSANQKGHVMAYQDFGIEPNKAYTISSFIKTAGVRNGGAFFNISFVDRDGNTYRWIDNRSNQVPGTTDWTERQMTFTADSKAYIARLHLQLEEQVGTSANEVGTAWFDNVQVEESPVSSSFNPIMNSSFERTMNDMGVFPHWEWSCSNGCEPNNLGYGGFDGEFSILMQRASTSDPTKSYKQQVNVNQDKAKPLTLTGMSKAENVLHTGGVKESKDYAISAYYTFQDGTTGEAHAMFPTGTHEWNRSAVVINETKPIKTIDVTVSYKGAHTGKAWFDTIRLLEGSILTRQEYDPNGNFVTAVYDEENRKVSFTYDEYGKKLSEIDQANNTKKYEYNADSQLTKTILANGTSVAYTYDHNGNTTEKLITANGKTQKVTYEYDVDNKPLVFKDALGRTVTNTYDANANLASTKTPNGNLIELTYDAANRLTENKRDGQVAYSFQYDANSNETKVTDSVNNITRDKVYDVGNRITSMTDRNGTVSWSYYDKTFKLKETKIAHGSYQNTTSYVYDQLNQNTEVKDGDKTYRFDYDEYGNVRTYTSSNGIGTAFHYDHTKKVDLLSIGDQQGNSLLHETYKYDADSNRTNIIRTKDGKTEETTYKYD
ncbi:DNRLRE domain-containing protein, partial [Priestia taiwanensis]